MKPNILAAVSNTIETDQRLHKVAQTLTRAGYTFTLVGTKKKTTPALSLQFATHRLALFCTKNAPFYAELNFRLFFFLWRKTKKDTLLLANDLDTLLPVYLVALLKRRPMIFDSHEIFSQLPSLQKGSFQQKIWHGLERLLVPKQKYMYTVSQSYAEWFAKEYGVQASVVRNVPFREKEEKSVQKNTSSKKILLYQGAINANRGIDHMIKAMTFLDCHYELWIAGNGPFLSTYKKLAEKEEVADRVVVLGRIPPEILKEITPKADIGLSLEVANALSYQLALPNKLFDYIQAGIPVIGSQELPEVERIIHTYKVGETTNPRNPKTLAECIQKVSCLKPNHFKQGLDQAAKELVWEKEEERLLKVYEMATKQA